jgi:hypothetical protein
VNQNIEVREFAKGKISVDRGRKDRPSEWDGGDLVILKKAEESQQFGCEKKIISQIGTKTSLEPVEYRSRDRFRTNRMQLMVKKGHEAVTSRNTEQIFPVYPVL